MYYRLKFLFEEDDKNIFYPTKLLRQVNLLMKT